MMKQLNIAVGIIRNAGRQIFITRRASDAHMGDKWEFPGGKIEQGESPEQALVRELSEEVGIQASGYSLYRKLDHRFPDRHLTLWFYLVEAWQGEPWGKEGQPGEWIPQQALKIDAFPPANVEVIEQLLAE